MYKNYSKIDAGIALNNIAIDIGIGIVFSAAFIQNKKE